MTKKEIRFLVLGIAYCIFGFTCVSLVSNSIRDFIASYDWFVFNLIFLPILGLLVAGLLGYGIACFRIRFPTRAEWIFFVMGAVASGYVISRTLLLTTELIHIPQFAICTVLFNFAFPRNRLAAIGISIVCCIADEWLQSFFPTRVLDLNDIFLNFIGLYIGLIAWWAVCIKHPTVKPV